MRSPKNFAYLVLYVCGYFVPSIYSATPTVDLGYAQYQGIPSVDSVNNAANTNFLGIRYAAAPTGEVLFPSLFYTNKNCTFTKTRASEVQGTATPFGHTRYSVSEPTAVWMSPRSDWRCSQNPIPHWKSTNCSQSEPRWRFRGLPFPKVCIHVDWGAYAYCDRGKCLCSWGFGRKGEPSSCCLDSRVCAGSFISTDALDSINLSGVGTWRAAHYPLVMIWSVRRVAESWLSPSSIG